MDFKAKGWLNRPAAQPSCPTSAAAACGVGGKEMKLSKLKVLFMVCLVAVFAVTFAWAGASKQITAEVSQEFTIGEQVMPAGKYFIEHEGTYPPIITCRNAKGEGSSILHVITTLSRDGMKEQEAKLVFDKTGGKYELSEIWFAGMDGYLVCGTVASHTHDVVSAK